MDTSKIFEGIDSGIVVFDRDFKVRNWNRWMAAHSRIPADEIMGRSLLDLFPMLKNPRFLRNCKSVLAFGNLSFFSPELHAYLFPMKPVGSFRSQFEFMQQRCTMGPVRDEENRITQIFVSVHDMTEVVSCQKKLRELTEHDALTGVYNRRFLEDQLEEEFYRCRRYSRSMSVIMIDVDFFKKVNDEYGHQAGDDVLKLLASTIRSKIRKSDSLARYGGEEFCCILPETSSEGACIFAENVRKTIENLDFPIKDRSIRVTISLGVTTLIDEIKDVDLLLKRADDALYRAKQDGRNRVVAS